MEFVGGFDKPTVIATGTVPSRESLEMCQLSKYKDDSGHQKTTSQPTFTPSCNIIGRSDVTTRSVQHSPIISPSSIPIPNPSTSASKQVENYPMYGGYLYSIPGYSAFQPLPYPNLGLMGQNTAQNVPVSLHNEPPPTSDYIQLTSSSSATSSVHEPKLTEEITTIVEIGQNPLEKQFPKSGADTKNPETDFEEQFTPEIIPTVMETKTHDSTIRITSLSQSSGSTISFPKNEQTCLPESKKKIPERFSLKTSIPISKIDMKCVSNPPDAAYQKSHMAPKLESIPTTLSLPINFQKLPESQKIAIHSNIVIKSGMKLPPIPGTVSEVVPPPETPVTTVVSNNMATLINAVESLSKGDMLWPPEQIVDTGQSVEQSVVSQAANAAVRNQCLQPSVQVQIEKSKIHHYPNITADSTHADPKNQIVFIPNKSANSSKVLLTISQQQPNASPIVLQKNISSEPKNLQAPSRLSSLSKKSKESLLLADSPLTANKVVALKRLHQDNGDENDFENLITENQIYGNKIVVKEKSQGTLQEQEIRTANMVAGKPELIDTHEPKNVFLQPNFLYLSNVQFPNVMMIKNSAKVSSVADPVKENKLAIEIGTSVNTENLFNTVRSVKTTQSMQLNNEIHVLKTNNNIMQSVSNKQIAKPPEVLQSGSQKVIMNPQIVYQVPMLVEDNLPNLQKSCNGFVSQGYTNFVTSQPVKKCYTSTFCEQPATAKNDKLFIACPYQMDTKLQPKIVITNLRPSAEKMDVVSSIDLAEKRRRMRRLKYLANRDPKDMKMESQKIKMMPAKTIVTPTEMKTEIQKEFMKTQVLFEEDSSDSESDCDAADLVEYSEIIEKYGSKIEPVIANKVDFFRAVGLTTKEERKEKETELLEKILRMDAVASACISVGRLDCINKPLQRLRESVYRTEVSFSLGMMAEVKWKPEREHGDENMAHKFVFMAHLQLGAVSPHYKEGYERVWQEIIRDRKKRNGESPFIRYCEESYAKQQKKKDSLELNTRGQLKIMTEIKKSVLENNNFIKRRLDGHCEPEIINQSEGIQLLAEKSFTELDKLSKMADRSVKIFSRQECASKMQTNFRPISTSNQDVSKPKCPLNYQIPQVPKITIPNVAKIISLKTVQDPSIVNISPAISMDEPQNSAAGVKTETQQTSCLHVKEMEEFTPVPVTVGEMKKESSPLEWPGMDAIYQSYNRYNSACKSEIAHLIKETSRLKTEALIRRREIAAANEAVRRLLGDKHSLSAQEIEIKQSVDRIMTCINLVKRYQ